MKNKISLAIDLSIGNGSFSIWTGDQEIDSLNGFDKMFLSRDLLSFILKLLNTNKYTLTDIGEIIYTNGPGSYTSLRVGVSSIYGLKRVLQIPVYAVSILEAYSIDLLKFNLPEFYVSKLIMRNIVATQRFRQNKTIEMESGTVEFTDLQQFEKKFTQENTNFFVTVDLKQKLTDLFDCKFPSIKTINASDNESGLAYNYYLINKKTIIKRENSLPIYNNF